MCAVRTVREGYTLYEYPTKSTWPPLNITAEHYCNRTGLARRGTPCSCLGGNCTKHPHTNPQTCSNGVCSRFICADFNATQCGLPGATSCQLGCTGPLWGNGKECVSTFSVKKRPGGVKKGRYMTEGSPCNRYKGVCGVGGTCHNLDTTDYKSAPPPFTKEWFRVNYKCV